MGEAEAIKKPERIPELDGVRGMAALLVVYQHLFLRYVPGDNFVVFWLRTASGSAWTGVHLFFILSAFLITRILLRERGASNYLRAFFTRRAFRILPLYFMLLLVYVVIQQLPIFAGAGFIHENKQPLWTYFLLVQNIPMAIEGNMGVGFKAVTWSVALEEQFYLFAPFLILITPRRWLLPVLLGLATFGFLFSTSLTNWAYPPWFFLGALESLALGCILGAVHFYRAESFRSTRARLIILSGLIISGILFAAQSLTFLPSGKFGLTLIACFWCFFLAAVLAYVGGRSTWIFRSPQLRFIGAISYGVYLLHIPIESLIYWFFLNGVAPSAELGWSGILASFSAFVATLLVAYLSFRYFESKMIRLGHGTGYKPIRPADV